MLKFNLTLILSVILLSCQKNMQDSSLSESKLEARMEETDASFSITFPLSEFESYISDVKWWASHLPVEGPGSTGPIPNPATWSRRQLISFIKMYNSDMSHSVHIHQFDVDFQNQLEYYVGNILESEEPPIDYTDTTPSPTFTTGEFDTYIADVKSWASLLPFDGPSSSGPIPHPDTWSRNQLIGFIRMFNNDTSHAAHVHQFDANFQTQLEYYVINVMSDNS